jgi:nucleoside-diphosphate-sugar epimerase
VRSQVHYRDAAACAIAALRRGQPAGLYLAADDRPLTREQIAAAALRMKRYEGRSAPAFVGAEGGAGKVLDCSATRAALGWQPKYPTFEAFVEREG